MFGQIESLINLLYARAHCFLVSFVNAWKMPQSSFSWVLLARLYALFFLLLNRLHVTVTQGCEYIDDVNLDGKFHS